MKNKVISLKISVKYLNYSKTAKLLTLEVKYSCEGFISSKVPGFLTLVKLLANTSEGVFVSKKYSLLL